MKKSKIITIIIILAVILVAGFLFYVGQHKEFANQIIPNNNETEKVPEILGNKSDLLSFSVVSGSTISGILHLVEL